MSFLQNTVVTSRVRLARNLKNYRFLSTLNDKSVAVEIVNRTMAALSRYGGFSLCVMATADPSLKEELKERYIISEELKRNNFSGAVAYSVKDDLSVMINEEDHIREQCLVQGSDLMSAYTKIHRLDGWLEKYLGFCKSPVYGYITACPTNLGTGMRASLMMSLPGFTKTGKIDQLVNSARDYGLTVRGTFGEGSGEQSCLYQLSNEVTLNRTEISIIESVLSFAEQTAEQESENQQILYRANEARVEDCIFRALGILTNCRILSYEELSDLMADVRLGVMLGLIKVKNINALDDLLINTRSYTLTALLAKNGEQTIFGKLDECRAAYIRENIKKILL